MEECPSLIPSRLRLSITLTIVLMVISSPVIMLVNPALKAASSSADGNTLAPSTIGQDGTDFTAQAPLTGVSARQTNNIVGAQSYYDVVFTTSTTGTIKFIDITFPAGTLIGAAPNLVEREGIGAGTAAKTSATVIRYTVTSAVSVPAGTQIRLEFFNIVNPTLPNTGYKVTVTTRNAGGTAIDGPTLSNSLNMKQIDTGQIAEGAVTTEKIGTGEVTAFNMDLALVYQRNLDDGESGWNPDGIETFFTITDPALTTSFQKVLINLQTAISGDGGPVCSVTFIDPGTDVMDVTCSSPPADGTDFRYAVFNPAGFF